MNIFNYLICFFCIVINQTSYMMEGPVGAEEDYYKILGVAETASTSEITKAYRKLALFFHTDKYEQNKEALAKAGFPDADIAKSRLLQINEAYRILSNLDERANYDATERGYAKVQKKNTDRAKKQFNNAIKHANMLDYRKLELAQSRAEGFLYDSGNDPHDKNYPEMKAISLVAQGILGRKDDSDKPLSPELQGKISNIEQDIESKIKEVGDVDDPYEQLSRLKKLQEGEFYYYALLSPLLRDALITISTQVVKNLFLVGNEQAKNNALELIDNSILYALKSANILGKVVDMKELFDLKFEIEKPAEPEEPEKPEEPTSKDSIFDQLESLRQALEELQNALS
jgi:curved DNA-binding protein CbpA